MNLWKKIKKDPTELYWTFCRWKRLLQICSWFFSQQKKALTRREKTEDDLTKHTRNQPWYYDVILPRDRQPKKTKPFNNIGLKTGATLRILKCVFNEALWILLRSALLWWVCVVIMWECVCLGNLGRNLLFSLSHLVLFLLPSFPHPPFTARPSKWRHCGGRIYLHFFDKCNNNNNSDVV